MRTFNRLNPCNMTAALLSGLLLTSVVAFGQNKTLGVGISTPNANAALHVESPTNNQGLIMPRLTTAQRMGMNSLLTAADNGLMLYDTELKTIFIWDGAAWKTTAEVAGGAKLTFPYKDSVITDYPTNTALLHLIDNNPAGSNRIIQLDNLNANAGTTFRVSTNSGWAPAAFFTSTNDTTQGSTVMSYNNSNRVTPPGGLNPVAIYGHASGTGANAAAFRIDNEDNAYPAVYSETNGTGPAAVFNQINVDAWTPGLRTMTDAQGAAFEAISSPNSVNARAAEFIVQNATNPRSAVFAFTQGTGPAIEGLTSTGWAAIFAENSGTGNGIIGRSAGTGAGISGETSTGWTAVQGRQLGTTGSAGHFEIETAGNAAAAFDAKTQGLGPAAYIRVDNAANPATTLMVATNGLGSTASFEQTNTSFNGSAIRSTIDTNTGGNAFDGVSLGQKGHGGSFFVQNAVNPDPAVTIYTQGLGVGLAAGHLANGVAIEMAVGTMKYSSSSFGTPGNITQRAGVYNITAAGTYTIDYPTPQVGETTFVFNSSGVSITVSGSLLAADQLKQFIYIAGSWRPVN